MSAIVFAGPTISPGDALQELPAVYLPPVSQGDVYRATQQRPAAIGIIDGYFQRVPAVWHKEILWAMSQGVHVFGSASMGALRAAELTEFGMEGVGAIFEAYRDGTLEDDDEVAVAHGPAQLNYRGQSEAMINIRRTLALAASEGVLGPTTQSALERIAKGLFYPERSYPLLLQLGAGEGLPQAELRALAEWLPRGRVDQKREDAVTMLRVMRERLAGGLQPKGVTFAFEHTIYWEHAKIAAGPVQREGNPDGNAISLSLLLDELRLEGTYTHIRQAALARFLGIEEARRQGMRVSKDMLRDTMENFRSEGNLLTTADAERWMRENDLSDDHVARLMEEEALLRWTHSRTVYNVAAHLPDYLRSSGDYPHVLARARDKQRALESRGLEDLGLEHTGLAEHELFRWYFQKRLSRPVETDIERFARNAGFVDQDAFRHAVLHEFFYLEWNDVASQSRR